MDRRSFLAASGALSACGLAGCIGPGRSQVEFDVGMSTRDFRPEYVAVPPGTTVTWKNTSGTGHTVTARANGIPDAAEYFATGDFATEDAAIAAWREGSGGGLFAGGTYEHTFEVEGEYHYYCIPHDAAGMRGVVEVTESATPLE